MPNGDGKAPLAHILHPDVVQELADGASFQRGTQYFESRRVADLRRDGQSLKAMVRGTLDYQVRLWAKDDTLAYSCDCPHFKENGSFCKHCVAVALAWLSRRTAGNANCLNKISRYLERRTAEELRTIILERVRDDPNWSELLLQREQQELD